MKKLLLSVFVVVSFAAYVGYHRSVAKAPVAPVPSGVGLLLQRIDGLGTAQFAQALPGIVPAGYRDGDYAGDRTDAYYGTMQVKAIIKGGRLADIQILDYPHDRSRSQTINTRALPVLMREALDNQTASVHVISGATPTSRAFASSLASALKRAKA